MHVYFGCIQNEFCVTHSLLSCSRDLLKVRVGFRDSLWSAFVQRQAPVEVLDED